MKEFALINKYLTKRAGNRKDVIQGIVTAPYDIGYKALAVNLSDLAAMGAKLCWATMALTLPEINELKKTVGKDQAQQLALSAGDDYELCFTVPKDKEFKLKCTQIGVIEQQLGLRIQDNQGNLINLAQKGYEHSW